MCVCVCVLDVLTTEQGPAPLLLSPICSQRLSSLLFSTSAEPFDFSSALLQTDCPLMDSNNPLLFFFLKRVPIYICVTAMLQCKTPRLFNQPDTLLQRAHSRRTNPSDFGGFENTFFTWFTLSIVVLFIHLSWFGVT